MNDFYFGRHLILYLGYTNQYWIGVSGSMGNWKLEDGSPLGYSSWAIGEPNGWGRHCVHLSKWGNHQYKWNDESCDRTTGSGEFQPLCESPTG